MPEQNRRTRVEPFSMVARHTMNGVDVRFSEGARCWAPCVDVRVPLFRHRLPPDVLDQDPGGQIYEWTSADWWLLVAPDLISMLRPAFPRVDPTPYAEGRSSGWLCVAGTGLPEDWTAEQAEAWDTFAKAVEQSIVDYIQVYVDNIRLSFSPAHRGTTPHGRCPTAGTCVEHAANSKIPACEYGSR